MMEVSEEYRVHSQSIMDEARLQREHEAKLAQISADRDAKIATQRRVTAESRHVLIGVVTGILAVLVLLLCIGFAWKSNVDKDRERRDRDAERADQVAELCIREGNIWINDSCLIARRE